MNQIAAFKNYLQSKNIVPKNITRMINLTIDWLTRMGISPEQSSYRDLMNYIGHLQKKGRSTQYINRTQQTIA